MDVNKYYCVNLKELVDNERFKSQTIARKINIDAKYFVELVNCKVEPTIEDCITIVRGNPIIALSIVMFSYSKYLKKFLIEVIYLPLVEGFNVRI